MTVVIQLLTITKITLIIIQKYPQFRNFWVNWNKANVALLYKMIKHYFAHSQRHVPFHLIMFYNIFESIWLYFNFDGK